MNTLMMAGVGVGVEVEGGESFKSYPKKYPSAKNTLNIILLLCIGV